MKTNFTQNFIAAVNESGFAVIADFLSPREIADLTDALKDLEPQAAIKQRGASAFGIRNLLNLVPAVRVLAGGRAIKKVVEPLLGEDARVVRGIFFDKNAAANWKVPFHQDLTIAVREKRETENFTAWTVKAGVQHVQPPAEILEKMLTVRIHLDDADADNGALKVVPRSHRNGRLTAAEMAAARAANGIETCEVRVGGAMLMRPLLCHASSASVQPRRRRVVHLDFCAERLPNNLEWYGS